MVDTRTSRKRDDPAGDMAAGHRPASGPVQQTTIAYEPGSDNRQTLTVDDVMTVSGFDAAGRVSSRTDMVDGKTFATFYTFDASDRLETITYPNGRVTAHEFDGEGRVTRVFDPAKPRA